jgi:hypothetical protein
MQLLPASLRLLFAGMLLVPLAVLAKFSDSLTPEQLSSTGLKRLSDTQIASVNALVDRELGLAQQGAVRGFAKSFCERRSRGELEATGLLSLAEDERAFLDGIVAERIAQTSQPVAQGTTTHGQGVAFPKNRSALEVHGSVTFMVGSNFKGGSFYGGAFETTMSDRSGRMSLTLGYSELHGKGMPLCGAYPYDYPYGYYSYANSPGSLLRPSYRRDLSASLLLRSEPDRSDEE